MEETSEYDPNKGVYRQKASKEQLLEMRALRAGWKISEAARAKIIARNMAIINDPNSSARMIGIATKCLLMANKQNIDLVQPDQQDNSITIEIKEV